MGEVKVIVIFETVGVTYFGSSYENRPPQTSCFLSVGLRCMDEPEIVSVSSLSMTLVHRPVCKVGLLFLSMCR